MFGKRNYDIHSRLISMLMIISSVINSLYLKTVLKTVLNIKTDYKYRSVEYNLLTRLIAKHVTKFKRSIFLCMYMMNPNC